MNYNIIYEDKYFAPGLIIYQEDFKKFFKIFPNIYEEGLAFTFIIADDYKDNLKEEFHHISFEIKKRFYFISCLFRITNKKG
jgi:hypothetical protein